MPSFRADIASKKQGQFSLKLRIALISLASLLGLIILGFGGGAYYFFHDSPQLPKNLDDLWVLNRQPSIVLRGRNDEYLGTRGPHYGQAVNLAHLPAYVPNAFLAMEDQRFYQHGGVDLNGLTRALWVNMRAGRTVQGGSTITQQLVKLLFLTPERTIKRKLQEIRLAVALEKRMSKEDILALYLNRIYFGEHSYGVDAAAQHYFSKHAADLTLSEAAMLAALPKAPSRLSPDQNLAGAQARAARVLKNMLAARLITPEDYEVALKSPAQTTPPPPAAEYGYIFDMIAQQARALTGGTAKDMVVFTTLDPDLQKAAQKAMERALKKNEKRLKVTQGALICLDKDGAIRAIIGGRSYKQSQFNRATQAKRQPGSAFKAIVYAAALENGLEPNTIRQDEPIEIDGWSPQNYGGKFRGRVTLRDAFRRSINTIAAQLTAEIGPQSVADLARRFGISTPMQPLPSIALGAQEASLLDMTRAYSVFANDGRLAPTYLIHTITSSRGDSLFSRPDIPAQQVYDPALAKEMTSMLQEVVLAGTGRRAALPGGWAVAGKTGTSQNWRDGWFIGFSAKYITGVWLGNDDNSSMTRVTGGALPAQIWHDFMVPAHKGLKVQNLNAPPPHLLNDHDEALFTFYRELDAAFSNSPPKN